MPTWAKYVGGAVLFFVVYGVVIGVFGGGFFYVWQLGRDGGWSWWHYALAVPALGAAAVLIEGVGHVLFALFSWGGEDQPTWRRGVRVLLIIATLVAGVAIAFSPIWLAKLG